MVGFIPIYPLVFETGSPTGWSDSSWPISISLSLTLTWRPNWCCPCPEEEEKKRKISKSSFVKHTALRVRLPCRQACPVNILLVLLSQSLHISLLGLPNPSPAAPPSAQRAVAGLLGPPFLLKYLPGGPRGHNLNILLGASSEKKLLMAVREATSTIFRRRQSFLQISYSIVFAEKTQYCVSFDFSCSIHAVVPGSFRCPIFGYRVSPLPNPKCPVSNRLLCHLTTTLFPSTHGSSYLDQFPLCAAFYRPQADPSFGSESVQHPLNHAGFNLFDQYQVLSPERQGSVNYVD